jgi:hypothetical protein
MKIGANIHGELTIKILDQDGSAQHCLTHPDLGPAPRTVTKYTEP